MTQKLGSSDKELLDALIPKNFGVGCRRPTVSLNSLRPLVVLSNNTADGIT